MTEPETTRPATWDDVVAVARLLDAHGVRWALIDGYAIAARGFVRFSARAGVRAPASAT